LPQPRPAPPSTSAASAFAAESAAIELTAVTGRGPCGPVDEYGRCSARYHALECAHGHSVDWLVSGPPRETFAASLANRSAGINLSGTPIAVFDDPDDADDPDGTRPR